MNRVEEERKPFLFNTARESFKMALLFMTTKEMELINQGNSLINDRVNELCEEAIKNGWVPVEDMDRGIQIENQATEFIIDTLPGYKEALWKFTELFDSVFERKGNNPPQQNE